MMVLSGLREQISTEIYTLTKKDIKIFKREINAQVIRRINQNEDGWQW